MLQTQSRLSWAGGLFIEALFTLFEERGHSAYLGEQISQTEHALQTAWAAERHGADSHLIVASLLHDVGHLLRYHPEEFVRQGIDDTHEELGFRWLVSHFDKCVSEPVRLHVDAKRYLCAVDKNYSKNLSEASRMSLRLQGGPFQPNEVKRFEAMPFAKDAVALRRYDDEAKVVGLRTPRMDHFRPHLQSVLGI